MIVLGGPAGALLSGEGKLCTIAVVALQKPMAFRLYRWCLLCRLIAECSCRRSLADESSRLVRGKLWR